MEMANAENVRGDEMLDLRALDRERRIDETVPRSVQRTLELRRALRFRREDKAEENNADSERRNRTGPRQVTQTVRTVGGFIRE